MEFTPQQKLIIGLLTDIHQKLEIADSYDAAFVQKVVASNNGWALTWAYDELNSPESENPEKVSFVANVLDMWELLERSYAALTLPQRAQLERNAELSEGGVQILGFDGNSESDLRSIASIFIDDLGRWNHFAGRGLNSHGGTAPMHRRMLEAFRHVTANGYGLLNVDDLTEVMNARIHPAG